MRQLVHRTDHLLWFFVGLVPGIINYLVWNTIYGDQQVINGFAKDNLLTYFLVVALLWYFIGGTINYYIGGAIKDGNLNFSLIKPIHPILRFAFIEQGWKIGSLVVTLPTFFAFLFLTGKTIPVESISQLVLFSLAIVFSAIIFSIWDQIIGMTAFFIDDIVPINRLNRVFYALVSGQTFPLALMPASIARINDLFFYRYTFSFPSEILFTPNEVDYLKSFAIQVIWIFILIGVYEIIYKIGIKRYEAYGA